MEQLSLFTMGEEKNTFSDICDILGCDNNIPAWPDLFGKAVRSYLSENNIENIRTLSLFSGAGGLDIGFCDVGFEIIESVEIEKKFCQTLELNSGQGKRFENCKVQCVDIKDYTGDHLGKNRLYYRRSAVSDIQRRRTPGQRGGRNPGCERHFV